jgi:anti-sigma factor RsiW
MSEWTPHAPGSGGAESAEERATREAQHQVLIDLLGAYADRELPPETTSQIEAHLVGCMRCRRELAMHHALRRRLGVEPPVAAPPALRERIAAAVATTPVPAISDIPRAPEHVTAASRWRTLLVVAIATVAAAGAGGALFWRARVAPAAVGQLATPAAAVPLLREVLADYRRVTAGDLPGRARDLDAVRGAVPFPITPLRTRDVRLVGAWTTEVDGEAAAVLAYRWEDRIVLEYFVTEERFFRHPAVRTAVADHRLLAAMDGDQRIVAWPTETAGALLIGDVSLARLRSLGSAELLARTVERGAQ